MKQFIRKSVVLLVGFLMFQNYAVADNDKPIAFSSIPAAAQQLVKKYFSNKKVAMTKMESNLVWKSYDVVFASGEKLEFDGKGNWTEISCKSSSVPTALLPTAIAKYVKETYSGCTVLKIEKDRNEYEVKLSNGTEVTFNSQFVVTDID